MADLVFGKYEVIRRLAIGGMGEIFLARQTGVGGLDRLVILKSLLPELAESEDSINQFLDEARVAATLNHPNVVGIFEVGLWEGSYFIAMEYIHGTSLAGLLKELIKLNKYVPPVIAARIVYDAALALDYAHRAKDSQGQPLCIVHRDISPQNIMVREDGITKVVDFGIAKAANRSTRTMTGELKGKLRYMPPEQIVGKELDGRSDQFSLGVVFWETCARRRLFRSDNPVEIFREISQQKIRGPSQFFSDFPPELEVIILKMLRREPADRFDSCRDVAKTIKGYLSGLKVEVGPPQVADFIKDTVGSRIDALTSDLTPSKENFIISFGGGTGKTDRSGSISQISEVISKSQVVQSMRRVSARVWGGVAAGLLVLFGLLWLTGPEEPVEKKPDAAVDTTPVVRDTARPDAAVKDQAPPKPPPVLVLKSKPTGASVLAGGMLLGQTPMRLDQLAPAVRHEITLSKKGFYPENIVIELSPGTVIEREIKLRRRIQEDPGGDNNDEPKGPGTLTLKTVPWTKVAIDGEPYGSTPVFKIKLQPGSHRMELVNEQEGIRVTRMITIKPGKTHKLNLDLTK